MARLSRDRILKQIRKNISRHGFHVYLVNGPPIPRYVYTIGIRESVGAELVFAGGAYYSTEDAVRIVNDIAAGVRRDNSLERIVGSEESGACTLQACHKSWVDLLLRGALDYYAPLEVQAYQIVPQDKYRTLDTPLLARAWSAAAEPVWSWLTSEWEYDVPESSMVMTNLRALRGDPVTEVGRWEAAYWEMFAGAGPDVTDQESRLVSLGTMLGIDVSLRVALKLKVGAAVWRDGGQDEWHEWKKRH